MKTKMKIEYRHEKVPCFGSNPRTDIELLRRINRTEEAPPPRRVGALAIVAVATSTVAFIVLFIALLQYCN